MNLVEYIEFSNVIAGHSLLASDLLSSKHASWDHSQRYASGSTRQYGGAFCDPGD